MSRMSEAEAIMWTLDKDPALRSDFTNITVLEGPPDEDRVRAKVAAATDAIPRLRQRVVAPPLRIAPPEWCDDPTLDLDYHLRKVALPAPGSMRELLDLAGAISSTPLDRSRPLWEFTLVEGLEGGRTALLQQIHHTITDGVGGLRLSLSLVDLEPDPADDSTAAQAPPERRRDLIERGSPLDVVGGAVAHAIRSNARLAARGLGALADAARHPSEAPKRAADCWALAGSLRRQALVTDSAHSTPLASRSLRRRYEVFQVPLRAAKEVASRLGGTLNDLYVTGLTGALGAYHERMGASCDELRMAMPVDLRIAGGDTAANQFAPARVLVPTRPEDPAERFALVHEALRSARSEPALGIVGSLTPLLAPLPTSVLVRFTRSQARTIDFAASNLRGSPVPLYVGGRQIVASYPMGPRSGVALNVTLLSYCDSLDMGINIDPAAITDSGALMGAMTESFDALLAGSL